MLLFTLTLVSDPKAGVKMDVLKKKNQICLKITAK